MGKPAASANQPSCLTTVKSKMGEADDRMHEIEMAMVAFGVAAAIAVILGALIYVDIKKNKATEEKSQ